MHSIKLIRENIDAFKIGLEARGLQLTLQIIDDLLDIDIKRRQAVTNKGKITAERNKLNKDIGFHKSKKLDTTMLVANSKELENQLKIQETFASELEKILIDKLNQIPNIPDPSVPFGLEGKILYEVGNKRNFDFTPKEHHDLGINLKQLDFEQSAKISGSRFSFLKGSLAKLERALGQYMLDVHTTKNGYTEISPPLLVKDSAVYGTGQLPKFEEDLFKTSTNHWLIPTAEVSLSNLVNDTILNEKELPLRFTALTPCFRSEAGSAGKDTKGLIRQHQFYKVELVSIVDPNESNTEHERMLNCVEQILKDLELPYRVVLLGSQDMGFSSRKTFDVEVWMPGQDCYREISSVSNCGDFQARRMNARFKRNGIKGTEPVHTLNGSGLAVGRTLIAIMENYQNDDGTITIPKVLQSYMKMDKIS